LTTFLAGLAIIPPHPYGLFLFTCDGSCWTFSRTGISLGPLPAYRQALSVPQSAVAAKVHQTLYIHGDVSAEITFDPAFFVNLLSDLSYFGFGQIISPGINIDSGRSENLLGSRLSYPVDVGERNFYPLIFW
jgi:hypothetical protein